MAQQSTIRKALLVDDEKLARDYLLELLAEHADIQVVAICKNGFEAVKACSEHQPDLIFLDIQMPKLDGFEVLELIDQSIRVIFVTAHDSYAVKAFEVHAVDYLLKPISQERLAQALDRVRNQPPDPNLQAVKLSQEARGPVPYLQRVVVKDGVSVTIIPIEQLDYIRSQDDYIALHSAGQNHLKHQTLTNIESMLDPSRFVRIHRSAIVNLERIDRIEPHTKDTRLVILKDKTQLPVSRTGYSRLKQVIDISS